MTQERDDYMRAQEEHHDMIAMRHDPPPPQGDTGMSSLPERLRASVPTGTYGYNHDRPPSSYIANEAADEIDRLREALRQCKDDGWAYWQRIEKERAELRANPLPDKTP